MMLSGALLSSAQSEAPILQRFLQLNKRPHDAAFLICLLGIEAYALKFASTKSQFTMLQNSSTYFARALR